MNGRFLDLLRAARRRRAALLTAAVLATAAATVLLPRLPFDGRIEVMLPARSEARASIEFLREVHLADQVAVSFVLASPRLGLPELLRAVAGFEAGLDPSLVSRAVHGLDPAAAAEGIDALLAQAPALLDDADLRELEQRLAPAGVREALRAVRHRMLKPEGLLGAGRARADPLGVDGLVLGKFRSLIGALGFRVAVEDGHFVGEDRRSALLLLRTPVPLTDGRGARRLVEHLRARVAALPPGIDAALVCGHLHTVGNEDVIRRDIRLTLAIASASFLLLFAAVFRDPRAVGVFVLPFAASVVAAAAAALALGRLSYLVAGLGSVLAGIAVDYGIHTYVAARHAADAPAAVARVARPVALGALTTVCVFVAFLFSSIEGYRQLAVLAIPALLLSLGAAVFVLPWFVRPARGAGSVPAAGAPPTAVRRGAAAARLALAALSVPVVALLAARGRFDGGVQRLDGTPPDVPRAEAAFQARWGGGESGLAILSVEADDEEEALARNDRLHERLVARAGPRGIASLAAACPSAATRARRWAAWEAFWSEGRAGRLRTALAAEGEALGYAPDAFAPFFERLAAPPPPPPAAGDNPLVDRVRERFLRPVGGRVRVLTFVPDEPPAVAAAREAGAGLPGFRVVSRRALEADLSRSIAAEVAKVSALGLGLIVLATLLLVRHPGMAALALLPPTAGVAWGFAAMALAGEPFNIANLVAGVVVFGLCIDYGIFIVYARRRGLRSGVGLAVTLSALTTVIGAGVLLFARHPALFSIGLTLSVGVSAGYLCALGVLPAVFVLFPRSIPEEPS